MTDSPPGDITRILAALGLSRKEALERLVPVVHDELRVLARSRLSRESFAPPAACRLPPAALACAHSAVRGLRIQPTEALRDS